MRTLRTWWKKRGLATRLSISNLIFVGLLLALYVAAINKSVSGNISQRVGTEIASSTQLLLGMIESTDKDLRARTNLLNKGFQSTISGQASLDGSLTDINGTPTPTLVINNKVVNLDFTVVDRFTEETGAVATIFAKSGDDFMRVTTSVKTDKQERAIGTLLSRQSPAYVALSQGQSYTGLNTIFGSHYMAEYTPIKDANGKIVGVSFIGLNFSDYLTSIKDALRKMKIGRTGYFYILDANPGKSYGELIVHPSLEGTNIADSTDADGRFFIKDILEKKNGFIKYPWLNKKLGETQPREKMVAYTYLANWGWIIAGGSYVDEYLDEIEKLLWYFNILGVLVVAALSVGWFFLLRQLIVRPIEEVGAIASELSQGDLTQTMSTDRQDEIATLFVSMNSISKGLNQVVNKVRQNAEVIASASKEIYRGNVDLSARTEGQASALEETAASMEELSSQVKNNADNAQQANQLASSASTIAVRGGEVVGRVVDTMKEINDSSKKIYEIVSVIDGIAFQTNILALNAAVEAARAGEQGRGFAVVASEVRSLAGRSADAAKEIKNLIRLSVEKVEHGTTLVDEAGTTMTEVVSSIRRVSNLVSEISSASNEQALGVAQVGEAVSQMDQATQKNAALVEQMAAAARSLESQASDLVETVAVFKLDV